MDVSKKSVLYPDLRVYIPFDHATEHAVHFEVTLDWNVLREMVVQAHINTSGKSKGGAIEVKVTKTSLVPHTGMRLRGIYN